MRTVQRGREWPLVTGSVLLFLALWEMTARLEWASPFILSPATKVVARLVEMTVSGVLPTYLAASGKLFGLGLLVSVVIGSLLAFTMFALPAVSRVIYPYMSALYAVPTIVLMPLLVLWLGLGFTTQVTLVILGGTFPVMVCLYGGLQQVDPRLMEMARSFHITGFPLHAKVTLPAAVPAFITGVRLAVGRCLIMMAVAEFYNASGGIGYLVAYAGSQFKTVDMYVGVVVIMLGGILLTSALRKVEERFSGWRGAA